MSLLKLLASIAYEAAEEAWREHKRRKAAAKAWAETPAPVRACFRCKEIAFTPGQVACNKCGALL